MFDKITEHAMLLLSVAGIIIFFAYSLSSSEEEENPAVETVNDFYDSYEVFEGTYLPKKMDNKTKVALSRFYEERKLIRQEFLQLTGDLQQPDLGDLNDIHFLRSQVRKMTELKQGEQENYIKNQLLRERYVAEFRQIHTEKRDPSAKVIADTMEAQNSAELHNAAEEYYAALIDYYQFLADNHGRFSVETSGVEFSDEELYHRYIPLSDRVAWSDEAYENALANEQAKMKGVGTNNFSGNNE